MIKFLSDKPINEMVEFCIKRTKAHIHRVSSHMDILSHHYPEKEEIKIRGLNHDKSKWSEEEFLPYVWETHKNRCLAQGIPFQYPEGVEQLIHKAKQHHISRNRHHLEYHGSSDEITNIDIIEIVCDWTAVAEELNKDGCSAKTWADYVIGKRFSLNSDQKEFLYSTISLLDTIKSPWNKKYYTLYSS
jgi:phosphoribosyl-AMP cyclohydrolase